MKFTKITYKSEKKLNQIIKKYQMKIKRLESLKSTFYDFDIEITDIQLNMIFEKIVIYQNILIDLIRFKEWKFDKQCNVALHLYHLEGFSQEELELVKKDYFRKEKMNRISSKNKQIDKKNI